VSPCSCGIDPSGSGSARMKSPNPTRFPGPLCGELLTQGDASLPEDFFRGAMSAGGLRVAWCVVPALPMPFFKRGGCARGREGGQVVNWGF